MKKNLWEELIPYRLLIRREPHVKGRVQKFVWLCVPVLCRGKEFTEPLLHDTPQCK
jgi:hypothetical protein